MTTFSSRVLLATVLLLSVASYAFTKQFIYKNRRTSEVAPATCCANPQPNHVCVMKTIFGLDTGHQVSAVTTAQIPDASAAAIKKALHWVAAAQAPDGGWGAG